MVQKIREGNLVQEAQWSQEDHLMHADHQILESHGHHLIGECQSIPEEALVGQEMKG